MARSVSDPRWEAGPNGAGRPVIEIRGLRKSLGEFTLNIDSLAIREPVTVCGLSMGGYVAFAFWQRHRQRVGKLVLKR